MSARIVAAALALASVVLSAGCSPPPVQKDDYPNMPITMVIPGTITGGAGKFGVALRDSSKDALPQPITLQDQDTWCPPTTGADGGTVPCNNEGGTKSNAVVAGRAADGYNTLIGNVGGMVLNPIIRKLPERKWSAMDPVARVMIEEEFLFVKPSAPFQTFDELITYVRANPPMTVKVAGAAKGGTDNFAIELLQKAANIKFTYDEFPGGGAARTSFLAGNEEVLVGNFSDVFMDVAAGTIKPIAVASDSRSPIADVPTLKEKTFDVVVIQWRGIFVPKGTPAARIKLLADAFKAAIDTTTWKTYRDGAKSIDAYQDTEQFKTFLQAEENRFDALIKELGL